MYGGFSRLIIVRERKKTFQFVGHAQEIFMHTVPLSVLTIQNTMGGQGSSLGIAAVIIPSISVLITFMEICILQTFDNCNIKLEQRVKLRSHTRLADMFKVGMLSVLVTLLTSLTGSFLFVQQGCVADYFEENSVCKPCRDFLNPFCNRCTDRTACETCDAGFYAID